MVVTVGPSTSSTASSTSSVPIQKETGTVHAPGLSSSGKLALEIALPLVVILIIIGIRLGLQAIYKRRAERIKKEAGTPTTDEEHGLDKKNERVKSGVAELDGREIVGELGTPANTAEMPHPPVELP